MNMLNFLSDFSAEYGYRFMGDYSGRGMYGRLCPAIRTDGESSACVAAELLEHAEETGASKEFRKELKRMLKGAAEDAMGLGRVVYFPTVAGMYEDAAV